VALPLVSRTGSARLETRSGGRQAVDLCHRRHLLPTHWSKAGSSTLNVAAWWESTRVLARAWLRKVLDYRESRIGLSTRNKLVVRLRGPLEAQRVAGILRAAGCYR
jgi:hypothetical protein